jgi:hypothetical protein
LPPGEMFGRGGPGASIPGPLVSKHRRVYRHVVDVQ